MTVHRLDREIPTAFEIAALVKQVPLHQGAALIEQYAKTISSARADDACARVLEFVAKEMSDV